MNDGVRVSVVVPVRDGARFLADAVRSVLSQLQPDDELIVVDDGSTDRSAALAAGFGEAVKVVSQPRRGAAEARNRGVSEAHGRFLAFLDADDLWLPGKLERQLAVLREQPEVDAALGWLEEFVSDEIDPQLCHRFRVSTAPRAGYHVGCLLVRREAFFAVGPFDARLPSGEFIDWWARAMDRGLRHAVIPAVVLRRRIHGDNHTLRRSDHERAYLAVARQTLQRRRQTASGAVRSERPDGGCEPALDRGCRDRRPAS